MANSYPDTRKLLEQHIAGVESLRAHSDSNPYVQTAKRIAREDKSRIQRLHPGDLDKQMRVIGALRKELDLMLTAMSDEWAHM